MKTGNKNTYQFLSRRFPQRNISPWCVIEVLLSWVKAFKVLLEREKNRDYYIISEEKEVLIRTQWDSLALKKSTWEGPLWWTSGYNPSTPNAGSTDSIPCQGNEIPYVAQCKVREGEGEKEKEREIYPMANSDRVPIKLETWGKCWNNPS